MKPLKRVGLKEIVVERLRKYIVDKQLQPGDRFLNEKEIVDLAGVSRTVVREALQALEAVGVLRIKPGDGIFVYESSINHLIHQFSFRWSQDQARMLELLETRLMLESSAIDLVVRRLSDNTSETIIGLIELDNRMEHMAQAIANNLSIVEEDIEFHRTLFKLTGNQTFYELSEVITQYFNEVRALRLAAANGYGETLMEHKLIAGFLKQKDGESAKKVMEQHLNPLKKIIMTGDPGPHESSS